MRNWQPIETAPKDGSWILAFGMAYPELVERQRWFTADTDKPRVPHQMMIKWIEGWYDAEVDLGDDTYRKELKLSFSYWHPEPHGFRATHWMPLPLPPEAA